MQKLKSLKNRAASEGRRMSTTGGDGMNERSSMLHDSSQGSNSAVSQVLQTVKVILLSNYVNALLVFVPLGFIAHLLNWGPTYIFTLNFLAIIPLASLLSFATEEISLKVGQTLGGLLNASFGNAVELIVSVIALTKVLGMCFVGGGFYYKEQEFNMTVAQTMSSLMAVATSSLLLPAAFNLAVPSSKNLDKEILILSRGTSVILLVIYFLYLFFQLKTHKSFFESESDDEEDEPQISPYIAGGLLVVVTVTVAFCADFLVGSIDDIVASTGISKTFVGLILIPIVGNAAEHVTAVICSTKNKMDLAIGVSLGSSLQIALFMTPFLVILGWIIGQPMTLYFKSFETITMFVSVLIVNYLIQDGKSNWLEGAQLMGVYTIIAVAFYIYPDSLAE